MRTKEHITKWFVISTNTQLGIKKALQLFSESPVLSNKKIKNHQNVGFRIKQGLKAWFYRTALNRNDVLLFGLTTVKAFVLGELLMDYQLLMDYPPLQDSQSYVWRHGLFGA